MSFETKINTWVKNNMSENEEFLDHYEIYGISGIHTPDPWFSEVSYFLYEKEIKAKLAPIYGAKAVEVAEPLDLIKQFVRDIVVFGIENKSK